MQTTGFGEERQAELAQDPKELVGQFRRLGQTDQHIKSYASPLSERPSFMLCTQAKNLTTRLRRS